MQLVALLLALGAFCTTAVADASGDYLGEQATGIYSGRGPWTLTLGATALTLSLDYDVRGALVGTCAAGGSTFTVSGKLALKKKGLILTVKSTEKSVAKMKITATVEGIAGTVAGKGTLSVPGAGIEEKKAALSGTIPPGSTDILVIQFRLEEGAKGLLGGNVTVTAPTGEVFASPAKGKRKSGKSGETIKVSATLKFVKIKGTLANGALTATARVRIPGFKIQKLPLNLDYTPPDNMAPVNSSGNNFIREDLVSRISSPVTLDLSATDDVGVTAWLVSENDTGTEPPAPAPEAAGWTAVTESSTWSESFTYGLTGVWARGDRVHLFVWFRDAAGNVSLAATDDVLLTNEFFLEGFESGIGDWYASNGVWEVGVPTAGPAAYEGQNVAATVLAGNYPHTSSYFISPEIQLPQVGSSQRIVVTFWHWFRTTGSTACETRVSTETEPGVWSGWVTKGTHAPTSAVWTKMSADVTGSAGLRIRLGFYLHILNPTANLGWYFDQVKVEIVDIKDFGPDGKFLDDFEGGIGDWWATRGMWEVGVPTSGPGGAHSGTQAAATVLAGNYPTSTHSAIVSPIVQLPDLAAGEKIQLRFWHWYALSGSTNGTLRISEETAPGVWAASKDLAVYGGSSGVWTYPLYDISAYAGKRVRAIFQLTNLNPDAKAGWYVDDFTIEKK